MGHIAMACSLKTDESHRPAALYCNKCKLTYKNTSDDTMSVEVKLCSAHRLACGSTGIRDDAKAKNREKAMLLLEKIDRMLAAGTPLHTAVTILGLTEGKFNKMKKL